MSSPNDNINLKDGLSAPYKLFAKDKSVAQDGSLQQVRHLSEPVGIDYGTGGAYRYVAKSGVMAAGLAAAAPIFAFRNPSASRLAIVTGVRLDFWTDAVGFAAGVARFELFVARNFTAMDTGGSAASFAAPQAKLRTSMGAPSVAVQYATTAALSAGTRTLDTAPCDDMMAGVTTAVQTLWTARQGNRLLGGTPQDHPLVLAQDEGFIIAATVPATGTWKFNVLPEWVETSLVNY